VLARRRGRHRRPPIAASIEPPAVAWPHRGAAWTTTRLPPAARPAVPPGCVEVRGDEGGAYLTCGQFDYVTTWLLWVGYRGERTLAVHDRLYPQVRQLIRDLLEELRSELAELDPRLTLTSIND